MKYTKILNYLSLLLFFVFISCEKDNDSIDTPEVITLNFTQETVQDQMGDFADNAMALFDDSVWSFAGRAYTTTADFHHEVWFSNNGIAWFSVADNVPVGRRGTTLTKFNNKLWIIGGEANDGTTLEDIWSSSDGENWTLEVSTPPFGVVQFHQTLVFNGKMYVIAGNPATNHTEVWSTSNGIDWTQNTANAAAAFFGRGGHQALVFNNAMYVIGGEATTRLNDVWKSTDGTNWTQVAIQGDVLPRLTGHSATVYNNKVWVIGGRQGTADYSNDIYYSSDMITWTKYDTTAIPFEAVAFHNTLNYNNALWLFGGYKDGGLSGAIWKIVAE